MKNLKKFGELNEAVKPKPFPTVFVPPLDESVAGSNDALVVYFDYDLVQGFATEVKKLIEQYKLETVSIKGNVLVVAEGEGPKGGLNKFKKALGL